MKKVTLILLYCFITIFSFAQSEDFKKLSYPQLDSIMQAKFIEGNLDIALPYVVAAKDKAFQDFGKQDSVYAEYVGSLGVLYREKQQVQLAEQYIKEAMSIFEKKFGKLHISYCTFLDHLGLLYWKAGQYPKAETTFLETLALQEKALGSNHLNYITTLSNLATVYLAVGNAVKAEDILLKVLTLQEKIIGKEHPQYIQTQNNLASTYETQGKYDLAEPLFLTVVNMRAKTVGKESPLYATATNNLAHFYQVTGNYNKAELLYLETIAVDAKTIGKEHPDYCTDLNNLAQVYQIMGRYDQAEQLYLETISIQEKNFGKETPTYARCISNLAGLYYRIGNYAQSEQLFLEALAIRERIIGKEHPSYGLTLNNLALLYNEMEDYAKAEKLYMEAIAIREKVFGKNNFNYGVSLLNLAGMHNSMGNYKLAEPLYIEAKDIFFKTVGPSHLDYANSVNNLALLYDNTNNNSLAEKLFLESIKIREATVGKEHYDYAIGINNIAKFYLKTANYPLTWEYLKQSILLSSGVYFDPLSITKTWSDSIYQSHFKSPIHLNNTITALSIVYNLLEKDTISNRKNDQLMIADLVNKLIKKSRDGFANEKDKLRTLSLSYDWMLKSLRVLDLNTQTDKAFEVVELNKASLLLASTKTEEAYQMGDLPDSLVQEEKKLLKKYAQLEAKLLENRPQLEKDSLRSILNKTNTAIVAFKKQIEKNYPKYADLKYRQNNVQIADVQKSLNSNSAIIEYAIGDSMIYIFYIDKEHVKIIPQPIDIVELNQRTKKLHSVLSNYSLASKNKLESYERYTDQAYWFYQKLLAPVLKPKTQDGNNQKNIKQLIFVTDGELGHLPFETFLVESASQSFTDYKDLHYLINDYKISYHYSATLFLESKQKNSKPNNGQVFAMAANYGLKLDSNQVRLPLYQRMRLDLIPLPEAQKEIALLEENFQGFFGFDKMASEKVFKEKAENYAIIHLAMHGLLNNKAPILSSLAFTEDGDSLENNFLQAYEISKMNLNADLVILSACETGFGKFEKGNGVASLARAFMYAGASSLIVSLWQVNDFATAELMKNLYQNLSNGMSKDEALQQAKLQYLSQAQGVAAHPAFWSAFVLIGDDSPIEISSKNSSWWKWLGLVAIILVIGVAVLNIKKEKMIKAS